MTEKTDSGKLPAHTEAHHRRFEMWVGQGLPKGWAENMGMAGEDVGDVVWPIVDNQTCGPIDGYPRPEQMLCWCPSSEKQQEVLLALRAANGLCEDDW